jgi:CHASE3 domain sensor protein
MSDHRVSLPTAPNTLRPRRVLLVDDEEPARRLLGASLRAAGFEVTVVAETSAMKKSLYIGFAALLLLLVFDGVMTLRTAAHLVASQRKMAEVVSIRGEVRALLAAYVDAETGERGFLLTGDAAYLKTYQGALATIERSDRRLKALLTTAEDLQKVRGRIETLGAERMAALDRALTAEREHGRDAALAMIRQGQGKELMDNIRTLAAQLDRELEATITELLSTAEQRLALSKAVTLGTHLVIAGALI